MSAERSDTWSNESTVYILGAGASRHCGVPVMSEFVDKMFSLYRAEANDKSQRVFEFIARWKSVFAHGNLDTNNVESLFNSAELEKYLHEGDTNSNADDVYRWLSELIVRTVNDSTRLKFTTRGLRSHAYGLFIDKVLKGSPQGSSTIVTFNYDVAMDMTLLSHEYPFSYCLTSDASSMHATKYLKLHGSVNWTEEQDAEQGTYLRAWLPDLNQLRDEYSKMFTPQDSDGYQSILLSQYIATDRAFIVPPTFAKHSPHHQMIRLWRYAYDALATARNIVFVGYSFPETDLMVRNLVSLGLRDNERVTRYLVVNSQIESVQETYLRILSKYAASKITWIESDFALCADKLVSLLGIKKK